MKGKPNTIRLEQDLEVAVTQWTEQNNMDFSDLVERALRDYIFKKQVIELQPVDKRKALAAAKKVMRRHRKAIDELK